MGLNLSLEKLCSVNYHKILSCSTEETEIFLDYINYCFYKLKSILVNNIPISVFLTTVEE